MNSQICKISEIMEDIKEDIKEYPYSFFPGIRTFFPGFSTFFPGIYYTRIFGSNVSIWQIQCFPAVDQFGAIIPVFLQVRN